MSKTETATNSQKGIIVGVSMLSMALIAVIVWYLFSGYGEITETGYQYARSLYTVCNQHDEGRLVTFNCGSKKILKRASCLIAIIVISQH